MEPSSDEVQERRALAVDRLRAAAERAKRHGRVPFDIGFVRSREEGVAPPLARMIQGGRGGGVRLRLLLCMTMLATRQPFDIRSVPTPASWARLLGLPPDKGPRRVVDATAWLRDNHMIETQRRAGTMPSIKLLLSDGSGRPNVRPDGRYLGVPIAFWTNGWLIDLSPVAIALFLILLEHQGGRTEHHYVIRARKEQYGLSADSWTKGRLELQQWGLLSVKRVPQGSDYDPFRMRNAYFVDLSRLDHHPAAPGSVLAAPSTSLPYATRRQ